MEENKAGFHFPEEEKGRTIFIAHNNIEHIGGRILSAHSDDFHVVIAQEEEATERERLKNRKFEILPTEQMAANQIYEHYPFAKKRKKSLKGRFTEQFLNKLK